MATRIYLRASTKDQYAQRALNHLQNETKRLNLSESIVYVETFSSTKLKRPVLNKLLEEANHGDILLDWLKV